LRSADGVRGGWNSLTTMSAATFSNPTSSCAKGLVLQREALHVS
jgi:hypothetical protein